MKHLISAFIALSVLAVCFQQAVSAESKKRNIRKDTEAAVTQDTDLIDQPTAGILEYYGFTARTRFFSGGGVLGNLAFGVLPRLNLGVSMSVDHLIGNTTPIRLIRPEIQVKYRFYDGGQYIPALALGYDGQGYYYDKSSKKHLEKGRGLYLNGSQEIGIPGFFIHPGFNVSDFDSSGIFGFVGISYTMEDKASLMLEWDNINKINYSRFNTGLRIHVTPFFSLDLAVREMFRKGVFDNGLQRRPERVVQLRYVSNF